MPECMLLTRVLSHLIWVTFAVDCEGFYLSLCMDIAFSTAKIRMASCTWFFSGAYLLYRRLEESLLLEPPLEFSNP